MSDFSSVANSINTALQDPVPRIGESPETTVELLAGYMNVDVLETVALVREMTGADEEFLASLEGRGNVTYPEYISALLKRCVLNIGDVDVSRNPNIIDDLIIGDRDLLFLAVIKATYGKTRTFNISCPSCSKESDILVDLDDDFPIEGTPDEARKPLKVKMRNGTEITLRLPTGGDTKAVMKKGKTTAEQNTLMIARCAQIDVANKEAWARSLNSADRNALVAAMLNVRIGPKTGEVNDPCPHCGETISAVLDWVSLLFG